jgi:hypothetical protein
MPTVHQKRARSTRWVGLTETLKVLKAEFEPGKGGEHDVPGLYAHVMLQAYELSHEKRYLAEAEKAASRLKGSGLHLFIRRITPFSPGWFSPVCGA